DIERDLDRHADVDRLALAAQHVILDVAHDHQRQRFGGAHEARAVADRALVGRAFDDAEADALAAHFHEAEMRNAADLDAGAIVLEAILELALDGPVGTVLHHVDEVDDDEAGQI